MRDDCFADILIEVAANTTSEQLDARLEEKLFAVNLKINRQFEDVRDSVLAQVLSKDMSEPQMSHTMNLLGLQLLSDAKSFVAYALPVMVQALQEIEARQMNVDREKRVQPVGGAYRKKPPKAENLRKSQRIAAQKLPTIPKKPQGVRKRWSGQRKRNR
jgi:hypothetical protein